MQVRDVMTRVLVTAERGETAAAASRLLARYNVGVLPVCGPKGDLEGIVTDRDLVLRCLAAGKDPEKTTLEQVMTRGVITVSPDTAAGTAAAQMARQQVRRLPVTDKGRLVGLVTLGDLAQVPDHTLEAAASLCEICGNVLRR